MENMKQNLSSKKLKETANVPDKGEHVTVPSANAHSRLKLVFPSLTDKVIFIYVYIYLITSK